MTDIALEAALDRFEKAAFEKFANLPRGKAERAEVVASREAEYNSSREAIRTYLRAFPSQVAPANPAQVTDAMVEHMVQQFLRWKLPEDFAPDGGVQFVKQTDYGHTFEPVGTNLFDYRQANAMVQHMLEGLPAATGAPMAADTWFTDRALPVKAMSGDVEDNRVLRLHFRRPVTDDDRKAMCDALNLHQASLSQPHPADERVVEALRETADALETLLSADPDMPTYQSDYDAADQQLERARAALAAKEGR